MCQNLILEITKIKKNAQKTKILKNSNNFAVIAILGDFEEFEGPVPEPPYPYHQNVSQPTEEVQPDGATSNNNSTSSLYEPDSAQSTWVPQKELSTFLEKQFRRKLSYDQVREILDNYNIPSVDCLFTPTFRTLQL